MPTFREDPKLGSKVPMIKTADLNEQCVTNSKILDGCITKEKLAKGTVDATTLANKSVGTEKLSDSSVTNEKISNKAVSTEKLADGSITKEKIFNASITTEKLANESVSAEKLQSGLRNTIASTYDKTIELDNQKANIADVGNAIERLENKIGERILVEGDVTNFPDEEDLTSVNTIDGREVMKLNDRAYEPSNFSGKGYKILRKNIKKFDIPTVSIVVSYAPTSSGDITITVNDKVTTINLDSTTDTTPAIVATKIAAALKSSLDDYDVSVSSNIITLTRHNDSSVQPSSINVNNTSAVITVTDGVNKNVRKNVLTDNMIGKPNTIYEIRYNFDLNSETIEIPVGCKLKFNGGCMSNGILKGNDTELYNSSNSKIFNTISILGTWTNKEVSTNWFNINNDSHTNILDSLQNLSTTIYIVDNLNTVGGVSRFSENTEESDADIIISNNHNIIGDGVHSIIYKKMFVRSNVNIQHCIFDGNWNCRYIILSGNNISINYTKFLNTKVDTDNMISVTLYLGSWYDYKRKHVWNNIDIDNCIFNGNKTYINEYDSSRPNSTVGRSIYAMSVRNCKITNCTFKNMYGFEDSDYIHILSDKIEDDRFPFDGTPILEYPTKDMFIWGKHINSDIIISDNIFYQEYNKSCIKVMASNSSIIGNTILASIPNDKSAWGCFRFYNVENCTICNNNIELLSGNYTTVFEFAHCLGVAATGNIIECDKVESIEDFINAKRNGDLNFSNNFINGKNISTLIMSTYGNINFSNNYINIDNTEFLQKKDSLLLFGKYDIGTYKIPVKENIATVNFINNIVRYKLNNSKVRWDSQYTENNNILNNSFFSNEKYLFNIPYGDSIYHDNCSFNYINNYADCQVHIKGNAQVSPAYPLKNIRIYKNVLRSVDCFAENVEIIDNIFKFANNDNVNYYLRFSVSGSVHVKNNIFSKATFSITTFGVFRQSNILLNYTNNINENRFVYYIETNSSLLPDSFISSTIGTSELDYGIDKVFANVKNNAAISKKGKIFINETKGTFCFNDGTNWRTGDGFKLLGRSGAFNEKPNDLTWDDRGYSYLDTGNNRMIFYRGWKNDNEDGWITAEGLPASAKTFGTTEDRPKKSIGIKKGYIFFDTTIGKPIWWTGSKWVDSEGTDV